MTPIDQRQAPIFVQQKTSVLPLIAVGLGTFVIGVGAMMGYTHYQNQQAQIAQLTTMVSQMQQDQQPVATRNTPLDLLDVSAAEPTPVAATVVASPLEEESVSAADQIRALASRAENPDVATVIANTNEQLSRMSRAIAGVKELSTAIVAGDYDVSTETNENGRYVRLNIKDMGPLQLEMEALLLAAAQADEIAVHSSVVTNDGSIDQQTLLFDVLSRNLQNGNEAEQIAAAELNSRAAFVSVSEDVVAPASNETARYYTVESGDSLAFISLQFYGDTREFNRIFEANRDLLSAPDKIQIGQRLLIPNV